MLLKQQADNVFSNGTKLLANLSGLSGTSSGGSKDSPGQKEEQKDGGKSGAAKKEAAGDFLGTIKGGIHTRLLAFGKQLLKSGVNLAVAGASSGGRHRQTETYGLTGQGLQDYLNLSPRDALARDIWDVRKIYQKDGLYTPEIRRSLQDVVKMNENMYPNLFRKKRINLFKGYSHKRWD